MFGAIWNILVTPFWMIGIAKNPWKKRGLDRFNDVEIYYVKVGVREGVKPSHGRKQLISYAKKLRKYTDISIPIPESILFEGLKQLKRHQRRFESAKWVEDPVEQAKSEGLISVVAFNIPEKLHYVKEYYPLLRGESSRQTESVKRNIYSFISSISLDEDRALWQGSTHSECEWCGRENLESFDGKCGNCGTELSELSNSELIKREKAFSKHFENVCENIEKPARVA